MKSRLLTTLLLGFALLLTACQPFDIPTLKPLSTEPPTAAPSSIPSSSPTQKPTQTAILEYTPTPTPISMPNLRVVFYTPDGIWRVDPPSSPVQIEEYRYISPDLFDIRMSDDGYAFVYLLCSEWSETAPCFGIYTMDYDGSNHRVLLSRSQIEVLENRPNPYLMDIGEIGVDPWSVEWIPYTHRILFSTLVYCAESRRNGFNNNLFLLDVDTGILSRLFQRGEGGAAYPSPDGKKMVIENYESFFLASIGGRILIRDILLYSRFPTIMIYTFYRNRTITWSADSSQFGIIIPSDFLIEDILSVETSPATIFSVDASTGIPKKAGVIEKYKYGVLSPTLEYVGYTIPGKEIYDRFSYDATISLIDGTSPILLAGGISHFHSFSPDGRYFSFSTGCSIDHYTRNRPPIYHCPSDVPEELFYVGSLDGELFQVPGEIQWINNSQFVYATNGSLRLGDVGGNWIEIAKAEEIFIFDAKDLDFQAGGET
jgi:hypothetical protein